MRSKSDETNKNDACEPSSSGDKRAARCIYRMCVCVCVSNVCAHVCDRVSLTNRRSERRFVVNQSVNCISGNLPIPPPTKPFFQPSDISPRARSFLPSRPRRTSIFVGSYETPVYNPHARRNPATLSRKNSPRCFIIDSVAHINFSTHISISIIFNLS